MALNSFAVQADRILRPFPRHRTILKNGALGIFHQRLNLVLGLIKILLMLFYLIAVLNQLVKQLIPLFMLA